MFTVDTVSFTSADAAPRFCASLKETGFAVLRDHSVPQSLIARAYGEWRDFFAGTDKHAFTADPERQDGYFPFLSENAKDSPLKDLKEFYHVYPDGRLPAAQEDTSRELHDALVALGRTLLGWIEQESPPAVRARYSEPLPAMLDGSRQNLLRILHYPPLRADVEPGAVRAAAHEDINLITLLITGSEPGLQARDAEGRWHDVPCDAGMITVNVGDMLQMASGGYYPSTTHRVVNPPAQANVSRYSMPMFLHPRPAVVLQPGTTADDYLQARLREIGLKS